MNSSPAPAAQPSRYTGADFLKAARAKKNPLPDLLYFLLTIPLLVAWKGYVVAVLWRWFLAPLGVQPIGTVQAIGLVALITIIVRKVPPYPTQPTHWRKEFASDLFATCYLAIGLLMGWIAHRLMVG